MSIEKKLFELQNLYEKNLISKDVYLKRQSTILNSEIDESNIIEEINQLNLDEDEIVGVSSQSCFFENDLIGYNKLKRIEHFPYAILSSLRAKVSKHERQIRFVSIYYCQSKHFKGKLSKLIIVPEQNINKFKKYKGKYTFPNITTIVNSNGRTFKKFKKSNGFEKFDTNDFVFIVPINCINNICVYEIDSQIGSINNFFANYGPASFNLIGGWKKSDIENDKRIASIFGKGYLRKSLYESFQEIDFNFQMIDDTSNQSFLDLYGDIMIFMDNKIKLESVQNLFPTEIMRSILGKGLFRKLD